MNIRQFNLKLATKLSNLNATMWTWYVLSIGILSCILLSPPKDIQGWLLVIVTVYYQGASLPVISFTSKIEGELTRKLLKAINDISQLERQDIKKLLEEAKDDRADNKHLLEEIHNMHKEMKCTNCDGQPQL